MFCSLVVRVVCCDGACEETRDLAENPRCFFEAKLAADLAKEFVDRKCETTDGALETWDFVSKA